MLGIGGAAFGGTLDSLVGGLRIFENIHCSVRQQFRFPRSKRRRIRTKWANRERNFRHLPDPNVYVMEQQGAMVGHPATIAKLRRELDTANAQITGGTPSAESDC